MYKKPQQQSIGTLRDITPIGTDADGDGGLFGTGIGDGCNLSRDCGS